MIQAEIKRKPDSRAVNIREDINKLLKLMTAHWVMVGGIGALISAVVSFGILMIYSKAIGRIDLLPLVFDKKFTALLPWMGLVAFVLILYMVVMFVTTLFYALAVSVFNQTPNLRPAIARIFFWHAAVGSLLLVGAVFQKPGTSHWIVAAVIIFFMALMVWVSLKSKKLRTALTIVALFNYPKANASHWHQGAVYLFAYIPLMFAVFAAAYPMLILLRSYTGKDTPEAILSLTYISMFAVVVLFLPALVFFVIKKHIAIRGFFSSISALIITLAVVASYPGASSTVVYKAAEMMGVREQSALKYRLLKNFDSKDFDITTWGNIEGNQTQPVVTAFPLFALGNVLLLCPARLNTIPLGEWPEHSQSCILTQSGDVVKLPKVTVAEESKNSHKVPG